MSAAEHDERPDSLNLAREVECTFCTSRLARRGEHPDFSGALRRHLESCQSVPVSPFSIHAPIFADRSLLPVGYVDLAFCNACPAWMSPIFLRNHACGSGLIYHHRAAVAGDESDDVGRAASSSPFSSPSSHASPHMGASAASVLGDAIASPPFLMPSAVSEVRPFAGRVYRVLPFVPLFAARNFVTKAREICDTFRAAQHDARHGHVVAIAGLFLAFPSLVLAPPRRSNLENALPRRIRELRVNPDVPVLEFLARPLLRTPNLAPDGAADRAHGNAQLSAQSESDQRQRAERCASVISTSGVSAAYRALVDPPLPPVSRETLDQLQDLHPRAYDYDFPALPADAPYVRVGLRQLRDVFHRLSFTAAPGLSGWRKALLKPRMLDDVCAEGVALFIELIINGCFTDPLLRCALLGSRLVALRKPGSSKVRPIAVGDLFVKLAAHFILDVVSEHFSNIFHPIQLGLGTPGGAETIIHACQLLLETDPDSVLFSVDIDNAFNSKSRALMAEALFDREELAALWRFFLWCYGVRALLFLFHRTRYVSHLWSEEGVRQGDVLGSFLFALSLQPALKAAQGQHQSVRILAFHDDIYFLGRPVPVADAFSVFIECATSPLSGPDDQPGRTIDLFVSSSKSRLFRPRDGVDVSIFDERGMPITVVSGGAFPMLGSVIGLDSGAVSDFCQEAFDRVKVALKRLGINPFVSVQLRFLFLRLCIIPSCAFLLRTVFPSRVASAARDIDACVLRFLTLYCLQLPSLDFLPQRCRLQANLPLRLGGFGLRSAVMLSQPSFLASVVNARRDPSIAGFNDLDWVSHNSAFAAEVRAVHEFLVPSVLLRRDIFPGDLRGLLHLKFPRAKRGAVTPWRSRLSLQRYIVQLLEASVLATLVDGCVFLTDYKKPPLVRFKDARDLPSGPSLAPPALGVEHAGQRAELRVRLGVLGLRFASLIFSAIPLNPMLSVPDAALRCTMRLRLGLVPVSNSVLPLCPKCDTMVPPVDAPCHPFSCYTRRFGETFRHNGLRDALGHVTVTCGLSFSISSLDLTLPGGLLADLLIYGPGFSRLVDVSVVCSSAPSYRKSCRSYPAHALCDRVKVKCATYLALAEGAGHSFSPVIFDAMGVPDLRVHLLLQAMASQAVAGGKLLESQRDYFVRSSLTQLAFAVLCGNLSCIRACWPLDGVPAPVAAVAPMPASLSVAAASASPAPAPSAT